MPRKSSKFINKADSKHFYVLHRSQTDGAYAEEGVPSEFVLVAADDVCGYRYLHVIVELTCLYSRVLSTKMLILAPLNQLSITILQPKRII
jgi:hypothetical protein